MLTKLCKLYFSSIYSLIYCFLFRYTVSGGVDMVKKIISRMLAMCPAAWYIFVGGVKLCVILLLACLVVLSNAELYPDFHCALKLSAALNETAQSVLLISVLFSVLIEDVSTSK